MRLALYFLFSCAFAHLSFVSGLRNVTVDDNDPSIIYSEGWDVSTANNPLDFGGFLHSSANSTATASVTFRGVAVYLLGPFWSSSVGAQVILDGQGPFVIDLHDNGLSTDRGQGRETIQSQVVWGATELPDTDHTMVISMPPGAQFVVLDGLIYSTSDTNNVESASVPTPESSTSSGFTTFTTTNLFTSSPPPPSASPPASSFVPPTTTSSSSIVTSSNLSSSSRPAPASQFTTTPPVNVAGPPSDSVSTVSASAAPAVQVNAISTNVRRYIVVGSIFAAALLLLVLLVLLTCLRRRRIRQRRQQSHSWSQKFTPPTSHAARLASGTPPPRASSPSSYNYEHSPATAVPLLPPVVPAARRVPRSPLAMSPPIMPPTTPSPQLAEFPMPPAVYSANPFSPAPMTPLPLTPFPPQTPLPMTPLPPVTPGTPWSTNKSNRFSASSTYSYESTAESGVGYGWTTPSLVGIHPFSAPAEPEPIASGSSRRENNPPATTPTTLAPRLNAKAAEALFHAPDPETQRMSAAPAYREKDAAQLFGGGRARAGTQASETAPPVYEP